MGKKLVVLNPKGERGVFTCEERQDGMFIATAWTESEGLYADRFVREFETYSAALAMTYQLALDHASGGRYVVEQLSDADVARIQGRK